MSSADLRHTGTRRDGNAPVHERCDPAGPRMGSHRRAVSGAGGRGEGGCDPGAGPDRGGAAAGDRPALARVQGLLPAHRPEVISERASERD
eukprot:2194558-Rhodomonas_salina.3